MGNTNSTETGRRASISQEQEQQSNSSSTISIQKSTMIAPTTTTTTTTTITATHPTSDQKTDMEVLVSPTTVIPALPSIKEDAQTPPQIIEPTKAVPVSTGKKSGWVSSTGGASPWYGSLSSSASSSHHRASISGPYYRTRGMSVTRDNENDEDLSHIPQQEPTTQKPTSPPATQGVPTIITWSQGGNNVYVTGTFNGWKHKIKLVKSTHDFSAVLELPPGTHKLKFIVDDEWRCSNEMETATDPDGNLVNYLQVIDDEEDEDEDGDEFGLSSSESDVKKYTNVIPAELLQLASISNEHTEDEQKRRSLLMEWEKKQPQPPGLPPHLEKVLLNSNTVSEEDNSVLHEPNHVTLNHLYACSIKDNVMALATTSRYRKKYVTTMYYRPVMAKEKI
ncbi:uncharacterized protein B0P05DRAFT_539709 [Gilbertella persicaria]|nr:uncharacterized protein B0P05DRAFT_539709 [Gilbertella persicaria]KAI8080818.1 hypothetical protein B0P05DRAFT_539709 [Gilbertella persicaria]